MVQETLDGLGDHEWYRKPDGSGDHEWYRKPGWFRRP
jgi:hypothetical protein